MEVVYIRASSIVFDSRATKEISSLVNNGFTVHVLGWNRDGIEADKKCKALFPQKNISFTFFELKLTRIIGSLDFFSVFKWFSFVKKQLKKIKSFDVIHACDLICGYPVIKHLHKNNVYFIYDIFDYYVDTHMPNKLFWHIFERMEIKTINKSDLTIICNEARKQQIRKSNPKKILVIHNSPDISDLNLEKDIIYDYVYIGAMGETRLTKEILSNYHNNTDLKICFGGTGQKDCVDLAKELDKQYDNFVYLGQMPYFEVIKTESKARVMSAIYNPVNINNRLCSPNKFYEALALGKPLIVSKGTCIENEVITNNIGVSINYDAKEFYNSLRFLIGNEFNYIEASNKSMAIFKQKYDWKIMEKRLIDEYRQLIIK